MIFTGLLSRIGGGAWLYGLAFAAGMGLLVAAYQTGVNAERKRGEAASLRAEVAALRRDNKIATDALDVARKIADANQIAAGENAEKLDALKAEIGRRPPGQRGALSRDDARRLRDIR